MRIKNPFSDLNRFEMILWISSVIVIVVSYLLPEQKDYLTLITSVIGVTALIFVAKGYIFGQFLCIVFALIYGIVSFYFKYYGEMITYLGMTAPMAVAALVSWLRHPYADTKEVEVGHPSKKQLVIMWISALITTIAFYFILKYLGTANLIVSTISITTSFLGSYLTFLRSPYYGVAYGANDVVLIILWVLASVSDASYIPMVFCFIMFLINDIYGFYNWGRIAKKQAKESN